MEFTEKRLKQELSKMTIYQLENAINQGLDELTTLVVKKPVGWGHEVDRVGNTLEVIKKEILRRERPE
jgi:hypothetical protein